MLQSYDDISLLAPGVDVAVSLDNLLEGIAPINDRFEFSRLSQFGQSRIQPGGRSFLLPTARQRGRAMEESYQKLAGVAKGKT